MARMCQTCGNEFPLEAFYAFKVRGCQCYTAHCKECYKVRVRNHRAANRVKYAVYEKERCKTPERRAKSLVYQQTRRKKSPEKNAARQKVRRAVQSGRLVRPEFCGVCGRACKPEAHHTDYSKPLDVLWLCFQCHREYGHGETVVEVNRGIRLDSLHE